MTEHEYRKSEGQEETENLNVLKSAIAGLLSANGVGADLQRHVTKVRFKKTNEEVEHTEHLDFKVGISDSRYHLNLGRWIRTSSRMQGGVSTLVVGSTGIERLRTTGSGCSFNSFLESISQPEGAEVEVTLKFPKD